MKTSIHPVPQPPLPAEPHMCWAGPVGPETKTWKQTWKEVSGSSDSRFKTVHRNLVTSGQWLNTGQLTDEPLPSAPPFTDSFCSTPEISWKDAKLQLCQKSQSKLQSQANNA